MGTVLVSIKLRFKQKNNLAGGKTMKKLNEYFHHEVWIHKQEDFLDLLYKKDYQAIAVYWALREWIHEHKHMYCDQHQDTFSYKISALALLFNITKDDLLRCIDATLGFPDGLVDIKRKNEDELEFYMMSYRTFEEGK